MRGRFEDERMLSGSSRYWIRIRMRNTRLSQFSMGVSVFLSVAILSGALLALDHPVRVPLVAVKVQNVEPANWRAGASGELVLQLSGEHLDKVVGVKVKHKGIRVIHLQQREDGRLLVTLRISPHAEPGTLVLQVFTRFLTTFAELPMNEQNSVTRGNGVLSASQ